MSMYPENRLSHNWLIKALINRAVARRLPEITGSVVDLGCGMRPFEPDILRHASKYTGVDWSNTPHNLNADVVADLNRPLPFPDAGFDHVVSFEVLEHLAEPATMLGEAFRLLRTGGKLTLSTPFQWWVHEAPWDYQRFTRYGLEYQLRKAGFTDIGITPISGFWSMWFLKFNYQIVRITHGPWWRRWPALILLTPIWFLNQYLAQMLDKVWREDRETAGYFVTAMKR